MIGHAKARKLAIEFVGNVASPGLIIGALMYVPLLNRVRNEIAGMGMEPERLYNAMKRFKQLGERGERTWRVPAYQVLKRHAGDGRQPAPPVPPAGQLDGVAVRPLSQTAAQAGPQLVQRTHLRAGGVTMADDRTHAALIIGAGFTGLGAAIKLTEAGVDDIVILERADRVGGTWRDTTYPGASCDIPSLLYSFSFVKNPDLVAHLLPGPGDLPAHRGPGRPLRPPPPHPVRPRGQRPGLRRGRRRVDRQRPSGRKRFRARTVVLASGPLSDVSFPDIRGIGQLSRAQDPQRPLGPRLRLRRQAGGRHRHRCQRHPDHSRTGQAAPGSSRCSSAPRAG